VARANIAWQNLESLNLNLKLESSISEDESEKKDNKITDAFRSLDLINVTHSYYREKEDGNFTLGPINLSVKAGEMVFLVGGNGSGKTTLAKIIAGLYIPESGEIRINGELVTDENREAYSQNFSMVFTDFYLFESLLGISKFQIGDKLYDYLEKLHLEQKVTVKDGKFSTLALSQGQRKRLALLTAYLEDRPCYIFDEWAADQDPIFKEIFYSQLLPELKNRNKAVLAITHDDRYFSLADRIVKLSYGKISEFQMDKIPNGMGTKVDLLH
jgi:putative ATP-binding cassette transporter